jgi:hypothetical protein
MTFTPIVERLTRQLSAKGVPNARVEAVASLQKHGVLYEGTEMLTPTGYKRQAMGPINRAKSRAARQSDGAHKPSDYVWRDGRVVLR